MMCSADHRPPDSICFVSLVKRSHCVVGGVAVKRYARMSASFKLLALPTGGQMDVRTMKARVETEIRKVDSKALSGTFYDSASDRLFITIVKGPRKVSIALRGRDFGGDDSAKVVSRAIKAGFTRLERTPIG